MCVHMESFGFEISETALAMRRDFDRRASGLGVTRAQWRVLARLNVKNGVRQVDLAEALDIEPITLCRMIDRLEDAGLVERRRDEIDRRAWNIFLTEKSNTLRGQNQVVFEVSRTANKIQIKTAVQTLFNVKVESVNTMVYRGKDRRMGRGYAKMQNWKKAVVTLVEGENIDFFAEQSES